MLERRTQQRITDPLPRLHVARIHHKTTDRDTQRRHPVQNLAGRRGSHLLNRHQPTIERHIPRRDRALRTRRQFVQMRPAITVSAVHLFEHTVTGEVDGAATAGQPRPVRHLRAPHTVHSFEHVVGVLPAASPLRVGNRAYFRLLSRSGAGISTRRWRRPGPRNPEQRARHLERVQHLWLFLGDVSGAAATSGSIGIERYFNEESQLGSGQLGNESARDNLARSHGSDLLCSSLGHVPLCDQLRHDATHAGCFPPPGHWGPTTRQSLVLRSVDGVQGLADALALPAIDRF